MENVPVDLDLSTLQRQSYIACQACGYAGRVLDAHHGYKWWTLPLGLLLACTGIGLIPLAIIMMSLGNRTFRACPKCKGQQLELWSGQPSPEDRALWTAAKAADEAAFRRNKLILLAVVMVIFAAALVFMSAMLRNL